MGSVVDFEDIFTEADQVLPPAFPKDHYLRANAPVDAPAPRLAQSTTSTSSYIFTLFVATVLLIAVYWGYSFIVDVRRRQREAFFQL